MSRDKLVVCVILLTLLVVIVIAAPILLLAMDSDSKAGGDAIAIQQTQSRSRYDNYRIYNVEFERQDQVVIFQELEDESDSLMFIGHARQVGQKLSILVAAHRVADFDNILATYSLKYRILTYNFQEKIDSNLREIQPENVDVDRFDWQHYFHLKTIYGWMELMAAKHAPHLTLLDMGNSTQGVPIKGIKLARSAANSTIFIESGIHAREWIVPAAATYIINQLLNSNDAEIRQLANNYNWIIFPSVNPDGYKYSFEHDRMWRKNRQLYRTCRGVDLNRNYPYHWNTTGASSEPCRYDFAGSVAASELETQRVIDFIDANVEREHIRTYIALHSYSQMLMFPYGHTKEHVKNYDDLAAFGEQAVAAIKATTGSDYVSGSLIETIYPSSGGSMDWAYGAKGIPIAYTFELRGPPDSQDMFILPAAQIEDTSLEALTAIKTIVQAAAQKGYYNNA